MKNEIVREKFIQMIFLVNKEWNCQEKIYLNNIFDEWRVKLSEKKIYLNDFFDI